MKAVIFTFSEKLQLLTEKERKKVQKQVMLE